jgi:hypothetical protein
VTSTLPLRTSSQTTSRTVSISPLQSGYWALSRE